MFEWGCRQTLAAGISTLKLQSNPVRLAAHSRTYFSWSAGVSNFRLFGNTLAWSAGASHGMTKLTCEPDSPCRKGRS